jgi:plastocyanin
VNERIRAIIGGFAALIAVDGVAQGVEATHDMSQHHGMIMNADATALPRDCEQIAAEHAFTIHAGAEYAVDFPGNVFGYSEHELSVEPCSRVTVTFVNDDQVRHQWMVHGLPRYLYPGGMFHLEANGGESQTGSFIVPSDSRTYLVHCDLTQHMEKGMKAQLVVGRGDGDLWAVPGISGNFNRDAYSPRAPLMWLTLLAVVVATGAGVGFALRRR